MFACSDTYFRLHLLLIIITTICISLSLRRTSAPIHLTSVLGVLGTQETFCIVIEGLLERDSFDLLLPEFDKPWVIHLRETYCCSTNLCTWRPNSVYKNRRVRRHQQPHRKLGAKYLFVLCAGFMLLLVQSKALDEVPYKLSGAVTKLADITFWSLACSYWFDKPQFSYWGKTCYYAHHTFLLGFPTGWLFARIINLFHELREKV
jgi:hypothetical protein